MRSAAQSTLLLRIKAACSAVHQVRTPPAWVKEKPTQGACNCGDQLPRHRRSSMASDNSSNSAATAVERLVKAPAARTEGVELKLRCFYIEKHGVAQLVSVESPKLS